MNHADAGLNASFGTGSHLFLNTSLTGIKSLRMFIKVLFLLVLPKTWISQALAKVDTVMATTPGKCQQSWHFLVLLHGMTLH